MEIKGIKYVSCFFDGSGYARAARGNVLALHKLGVPLTLSPVSFEAARPNLGEDGKILESLVGKNIDYNIVLVHLTPEFWSKHVESTKINCGYTIWETSRLHPDWPRYMNIPEIDKVLVGCHWNKDVFKSCGVEKPIGVVPHGINMDDFKNITPFPIAGVDPDAYVFYSIFQWTERKHPLALIKAYWHEFNEEDNVALVLKTYRSSYDESEKEAIRLTLKRVKMVTPMDYYPPIYFLPNMLSEAEMCGLHARGDCYVSLDRGEGFGLSPFTAGACGNPIVITGYGGAREYAKDNNSYLVDYMLTPVFGMPWCISLNSLIKTDEGYKKAKYLKEGSLLRNKNLNFKKINKIEFRSLLDEEDIYSFKYFSMPSPIEITNNHRLYVLNEKNEPVLKKAKEINVGDYLYVPKPVCYNETPKSVLKLGDCIDSYEKLAKLFYLSGIYLAEGYIEKNNYYISFSFNIAEKYTLGQKCKELMEYVFGASIRNIYERDLEDRNGYEINFYFDDNKFIDFFHDNFGSGSHEKYISDEIKYNELNKEVLKGYWAGDGHIRKEGYKNKKTGKKRISPECVAETASFDLAVDLRDLLLTINIVPSVYKSERKDGRISYILSVSDEIFDSIFNIDANRIGSKYKKILNNGFGVLITKKELLEDYDDLICSISVDVDKDESIENGGSYILNGIASSNSPWYRGDQLWAEPDILHGARLMREAFSNQEESKKRGRLLKKYISENFTWDHIGQRIIEEIEKI